MIDLAPRPTRPQSARLPSAGARLPARLRQRAVLVVPPVPGADRRE
ncbi:hypothetical protein ACI79Q_15355 [Blastococcus sp. SYSU DS0828]